jgi:DNA-binding transcriptional ArsR family regulator/uncharacterized protein YndB with AHSA1/START domain
VGDVQQILAALNSPIRREILWRIWDEELPAGAIASAFQLAAPTISEHLAVLREAGLVTMHADGTFRRYRARRDALRGLQSLLFAETTKWTTADDLPERHKASARTMPVVVAAVDVDCDQATAFAGFTDPVMYSQWLGVPVTLDDGRFACTMEWGTRVRGTYDVVVPPSFLALRWDFEDDAVPVPGAQLAAYVHIDERESRSHVEVHQLVENDQQAGFMEVAWTMVLGRFKEGIAGAASGRRTGRRAPRPKRVST